ncbi:MAG: pyroglutamyl-peptidase I [Lachnospiraceae bacterium]|jgi:pyroglutamyl-peptidase|nr:pyroglutamyl-peptidase I [Lachnospiraceae bacterium]MCX4316881.1 pyroglutamyl-peptidase I [Lachnospiraceae bacterium]
MNNTILITGFAPFGGETINPAYEAVKALPDTIEGMQIQKEEIPVVFHKSGVVLQELMERYKPAAVLCIGQAGGRAAMTIERVAINLMEASAPDNEGNQPQDEAIRQNAPAAYFATIPVKAIAAAMREAGVPAHLSYTAGTYVCNSTMYELLDLCATQYPEVLGGFIHVPYASGQALTKAASTPFMELSAITKGLEAALRVIAEELKSPGSFQTSNPPQAEGTIC